MIFFGKKKKKKAKKTKAAQPQSREELIAQAKENARIARENIGEETLDRIAAAMQKKEQSATEQAKAKIKGIEKEKVADHIKLMMDDK